MVKLPPFHRACCLLDQFVAHIQGIKWRLRRPTVLCASLSVCAFVSAAAIILFFFAHQSGENDDKFLNHDLPLNQTRVRLLLNLRTHGT